MTTAKSSWRGGLRIHLASELLPHMAKEELFELGSSFCPTTFFAADAAVMVKHACGPSGNPARCQASRRARGQIRRESTPTRNGASSRTRGRPGWTAPPTSQGVIAPAEKLIDKRQQRLDESFGRAMRSELAVTDARKRYSS
jgi:hypothetical protein